MGRKAAKSLCYVVKNTHVGLHKAEDDMPGKWRRRREVALLDEVARSGCGETNAAGGEQVQEACATASTGALVSFQSPPLRCQLGGEPDSSDWPATPSPYMQPMFNYPGLDADNPLAMMEAFGNHPWSDIELPPSVFGDGFVSGDGVDGSYSMEQCAAGFGMPFPDAGPLMYYMNQGMCEGVPLDPASMEAMCQIGSLDDIPFDPICGGLLIDDGTDVPEWWSPDDGGESICTALIEALTEGLDDCRKPRRRPQEPELICGPDGEPTVFGFLSSMPNCDVGDSGGSSSALIPHCCMPESTATGSATGSTGSEAGACTSSIADSPGSPGDLEGSDTVDRWTPLEATSNGDDGASYGDDTETLNGDDIQRDGDLRVLHRGRRYLESGRELEPETLPSLRGAAALRGQRQPLSPGATTAMLRNIPNKYTRERLVEQLNKRQRGEFDFVYLPIDFNNGCNVGYGFINFCSVEAHERFIEMFDGVDVSDCLPGVNSRKVVEVWPARVHGLEENVERLRNSPVMTELLENPEWMPLLFDNHGSSLPFPAVGETPRHANKKSPSRRAAPGRGAGRGNGGGAWKARSSGDNSSLPQPSGGGVGSGSGFLSGSSGSRRHVAPRCSSYRR